LGVNSAVGEETTWGAIGDESLTKFVEDPPHEKENARNMKIYERRVASLTEDNTGATNPTLRTLQQSEVLGASARMRAPS
jgi:hypothetical protein